PCGLRPGRRGPAPHLSGRHLAPTLPARRGVQSPHPLRASPFTPVDQPAVETGGLGPPHPSVWRSYPEQQVPSLGKASLPTRAYRRHEAPGPLGSRIAVFMAAARRMQAAGLDPTSNTPIALDAVISVSYPYNVIVPIGTKFNYGALHNSKLYLGATASSIVAPTAPTAPTVTKLSGNSGY